MEKAVEKIVERNNKRWLVKYVLGPRPKNFREVLEEQNIDIIK